MVVTVMTGQRYTLSAWAGKGRRDVGTGPNDDFMQIDAAVSRDNSGGRTVDI
jgi:S1-C subfamily serine protease